MTDEFDEQIKRLTACPTNIGYQWTDNIGLFAGLLSNAVVGCLTQIRYSPAAYKRYAVDTGEPPEIIDLVGRVAADERIPDGPNDITLDLLPVFAEYQREHKRIRAVINERSAANA